MAANNPKVNSFGEVCSSYRRRSLIKEFQDIMREYPAGVQIFHELVQNAEDAKAPIFKLLYDSRSIDPPVGRLYKFLKSPALCIYNEGVFEEQDWIGIQSVCLSHKEDKPDKIGRYGQGFKSVFHLTDYPVVISGGQMLRIDPFEVDEECITTRLSQIETELKHSGIMKCLELTGQSVKGGYYHGTLFWFPLRQTVNEFSSSIWSAEKMLHLVHLFEEDAVLTLLFLKYIEQIEIQVIQQNGTVQERQNIKMKYDDKKRERLQDIWSNIVKENHESENVVSTAEMSIMSNKLTKQQMWTVVHYYAGPPDISNQLKKLANDKEISCLPYVGVAYTQDETHEHGRIFNFLPLPAVTKTELPVHVNGNFVLSQNRHYIKLSDGRTTDKFIKWNEMLIKELMPNAYSKLVYHLIEMSKDKNNTDDYVDTVYNCFPQRCSYASVWQGLVDNFYSRIIKSTVYFSRLQDRNWVDKNKAVEICTRSLSAFSMSEQHQICDTTKLVLHGLKIPVIEKRRNMTELIKYGNLKRITPCNLVNELKKSPEVYRSLSWQGKTELLQYLISDQRNRNAIEGLELLPLQNQNFVTFDSRQIETFVCSFESMELLNLFPGQNHRFISSELPQQLFKNLYSMAIQGAFQLKILGNENIPRLLADVFYSFCTPNNNVYLPKDVESPLDSNWITSVWKMIHKLEFSSISYEHIPLIPQFSQDSKNIQFHVLKGDYILYDYKQKGLNMMKPLPDEVMDMLKTYGIVVLRYNTIMDLSRSIGSYVQFPAEEGVLELCKNKPNLKERYISYVGLSGNMWLPENTTAVPFGQREKLVTRLKNILSNYPQTHCILKEMIQNADDAGASEIHFVYDMRNRECSKIFNEKWKPLQGPALCVYNDACFTDLDLEGIKNLGIGSKTKDNTKTGQFGIGFNAVYHLTDAPSFISIGESAAKGGIFCVLDPQCQYAPLAKFSNPGMLMELPELKQKFPDVFDSFLSTKELKNNEGTWFRLPLRTLEMAKKSEIKKEHCNSQEINNLMEKMSTEVEECLLFLLNVQKICISYIDYNSKYTISKKVALSFVEDAESELAEFKESLKEYNAMIEAIPLQLEKLHLKKNQYLIDIDDQCAEQSRWLIVQTLGFKNPDDIDQRLIEAINKEEISIIPRGGVAYKVLDNCEIEKKDSCSRVFCLLPLEIDTGLTCHINGQFSVDVSRNKLWGIDSSFTDNARGLWNLELIRKNVSFAYAACINLLKSFLFNGANQSVNRNKIEKSFIWLFNSLFSTANESLIKNKLEKYLRVIPVFDHAKSDFWKELIYYTFLHAKIARMQIFPICSYSCHAASNHNDITLQAYPGCDEHEEPGWIMRHCELEMPVLADHLSNDMSLEEACVLRSVLVDLGMKLVCIPPLIQKALTMACEFKESRETHDKRLKSAHDYSRKTCICIKNISPKETVEFFRSASKSGPDKLDIEKRTTDLQIKVCLKYCLRNESIV